MIATKWLYTKSIEFETSEEKIMQITDIKVRKLFDEGPMKAIVSVTFDSQLAVHDIKVIFARDRYFIVMPSRKNPDETYRDIVHPINAQFRAMLEDAVIKAFEEAVEAARIEAQNAEDPADLDRAAAPAL
jgi:stage V sporulation protein G